MQRGQIFIHRNKTKKRGGAGNARVEWGEVEQNLKKKS